MVYGKNQFMKFYLLFILFAYSSSAAWGQLAKLDNCVILKLLLENSDNRMYLNVDSIRNRINVVDPNSMRKLHSTLLRIHLRVINLGLHV